MTAFRQALFTDLYELTMAQAYWAEHMDGIAVFELAFRQMPPNRNYIVVNGLADIVDFLTNFRIASEDLDYLRKLGGFSGEFLRDLEQVRFTGNVCAMPEGTLVFPNEPLVQVIAPILEAQLMETFILNQVHFQSLAASKAARVVAAAKGRVVVDFGSRRAHGTDAALKVARATYLAGGHGTSNVLAGKLYGIPVLGTMAHSYIQAHEGELASFEAFSNLYPETTLLVDTYDTLKGAGNVIDLSRKLGPQFRIAAIRLDSGDLAGLASAARKMLDEAGLHGVKIFASSGLDEYKVQALVACGAPIDAFGVGTKLAVMADAPELDMAYKLVQYEGKGRLKLSTKKVLYPGRKQVFRQVENGQMVQDTIGRFDERLPGEPLLEPLIRKGEPVCNIDLNQSRWRLAQELDRLPEPLRRLEPPALVHPIAISERLQSDFDTLSRALTR